MRGQSLIELLVGIALGAIFIVGGTVLIAPSLQSNKQVTAVQTRAELGSELAQNVRSWAAGNWNNVLALATSTSCIITSDFVQGAIDTEGGTEVDLTFPSNNTAGNLIVVAVDVPIEIADTASISDSQGNTYQTAVGPIDTNYSGGFNDRGLLFYAANIKGGANTITVTRSQLVGNFTAIAGEYQNIQASSPLDQGVGTSTNDVDYITSGNTATTTFAKDMLVGAGYFVGGASTFTVGSGFSLDQSADEAFMFTEEKDVSTIGQYFADASLDSNNSGFILAAAFKKSGGVSPYYLNVSSSPFTANSGKEQIALSNVTYTRQFCVLDAYRDSSGNATTTASGNSYDPSTKLIDVVVSASGVNASGTTVFGLYLSRNGNNIINQTNWSGGSGQNTPVTSISNTFATSSNVAANASGSLQLTPPVGGSCTI